MSQIGALAKCATRQLIPRNRRAPCLPHHVRAAIAACAGPGSVRGIAGIPAFKPVWPRKGYRKHLHRTHVATAYGRAWFPSDRSSCVVAGIEAWLLANQRCDVRLPPELAQHVVSFLRPAEWQARKHVPAAAGQRLLLAPARAARAAPHKARRRLPPCFQP